MSTSVASTLARLAKMNNANTKTKAASTTTTKFFKPKPGKNNLLLLPTLETGDPFVEWHTHKNLLEKPYMDIACNKMNKGEECLICQVVDDLQKADWKGNYPLWKPLELKTRYYSPVIDLDDIDAGVQMWGYGKSVLAQFETWLLNLEEDEKVFFDIESPQKVLVTYNNTAAPADMYKLDKKILKPFPADQVQAWREAIRPLKDIMGAGKSESDIAAALENYMETMKDQVDATDVDGSATSKLGSLKAKK